MRASDQVPPRTPLDRQKIVEAAYELIQRDGLSHLTMRSLSRQLNVEAASLYGHVRSKEDILDGVVALVHAQISIPDVDVPWPERVRLFCGALRSTMLANPELVLVMATRPLMSPATRDLTEAVLREIRAIGFNSRDAVHTLQTMVAVVLGHVLRELQTHPALHSPESRAAAQATLAPERYPELTAALAHGVPDREAEFAHAVQVVIDGIAVACSRT